MGEVGGVGARAHQRTPPLVASLDSGGVGPGDAAAPVTLVHPPQRARPPGDGRHPRRRVCGCGGCVGWWGPPPRGDAAGGGRAAARRQ